MHRITRLMEAPMDCVWSRKRMRMEIVVLCAFLRALPQQAKAEMPQPSFAWRDELLAAPYGPDQIPGDLTLELLRQDFESLEYNRSVIKTPLTIGERSFDHGLGTHANSHIRIHSSL